MSEAALRGVVLDCMIYLQAVVNERGPAARLLSLMEEPSLPLFISQEILDEIREVLARPRLHRKFPSLTDERIAALIADLSRQGTLVADVPAVFRLKRDPKDEKYVNLAIATHAYLVTWDRDLLDLMDDSDFRRLYPELTILDPVALLRAMVGNQNGEGS